jgi:hypothetical protein
MLRFKVVILSLSALLTVGAVASASAPADTCTGGAHFVFCTFPGNVPVTHLAVSGEGGLAILASKVGAVEVKFHCTDDKLAGTLGLLGLASGEEVLLGCATEKPANCTIPSLILTEVHIQVESATKGLFSGAKGGTGEFTTITVSGSSCAISGSYPITGTQEVEFPEGQAGKKEHEIVAKKSGSKLKIGEESGSFSGFTTAHVDSGEEGLLMAGE